MQNLGDSLGQRVALARSKALKKPVYCRSNRGGRSNATSRRDPIVPECRDSWMKENEVARIKTKVGAAERRPIIPESTDSLRGREEQFLAILEGAAA